MDEVDKVIESARRHAEEIAAREVCLGQMAQIFRILDGGEPLDGDCAIAKRVADVLQRMNRAESAVGLIQSYAAVLAVHPGTPVENIVQELKHRIAITTWHQTTPQPTKANSDKETPRTS